MRTTGTHRTHRCPQYPQVILYRTHWCISQDTQDLRVHVTRLAGVHRTCRCPTPVYTTCRCPLDPQVSHSCQQGLQVSTGVQMSHSCPQDLQVSHSCPQDLQLSTGPAGVHRILRCPQDPQVSTGSTIVPSCGEDQHIGVLSVCKAWVRVGHPGFAHAAIIEVHSVLCV